MNMSKSGVSSDIALVPHERTLRGITMKFLIDTSTDKALFETVDFNTLGTTPQMNLKFFCALLRNCTSELVVMGIKSIYYFAIREEYGEFKDRTTWVPVPFDSNNNEVTTSTAQAYGSIFWNGSAVTRTVLPMNSGANYKNLILLSCNIENFAENMASGLGIDLV